MLAIFVVPALAQQLGQTVVSKTVTPLTPIGDADFSAKVLYQLTLQLKYNGQWYTKGYIKFNETASWKDDSLVKVNSFTINMWAAPSFDYDTYSQSPSSTGYAGSWTRLHEGAIAREADPPGLWVWFYDTQCIVVGGEENQGDFQCSYTLAEALP
jgi:hypothetical protein